MFFHRCIEQFEFSLARSGFDEFKASKAPIRTFRAVKGKYVLMGYGVTDLLRVLRQRRSGDQHASSLVIAVHIANAHGTTCLLLNYAQREHNKGSPVLALPFPSTCEFC